MEAIILQLLVAAAFEAQYFGKRRRPDYPTSRLLADCSWEIRQYLIEKDSR